MSEHAAALADRFRAANEAVIAFVEAAPDGLWRRECPAERCTVAALASHVAGGHGAILDGIVRPIAEGTPGPRYTMDDLARMNAERAAADAARPKAEVLAQLRAEGARAEAYLRGLSDERLGRTGVPPWGGDPVPAAAMAEHVLVGHPEEHLASLRQAAGQEAGGGPAPSA